MDYDLSDYTGSTDAMDCTLAAAGLNGTQDAHDADGYTMTGVIATPGETRVTVQLPAEAPDGAVLQLFTPDGQKLQCANSRPNGDGSAVTYDFDAVPAEDAALTARMVNKNIDPLTVLAQWQIALPQG